MSTPLRLASSPWGFRRTPQARQCAWLREHGLRLRCSQFFPGEPGLLDPGLDAAGMAKVAAETAAHGLGWASFNAGGDFLVDAKDLDAQIAQACSEITRAAPLKPDVIIVFAGWQPKTGPDAERQAAKALRTVAGHAAGLGLRLALENHGGLTTTAAQVNRILDLVAAPNIGVNFDAANVLFYGEDPLAFLRALRHPVVFTHCKSVRTVGGKKEYCRLRDGVIDYAPLMAHLAAAGYAGIHAIEYEETADVESGAADDLADLRAVFAKLGLATA